MATGATESVSGNKPCPRNVQRTQAVTLRDAGIGRFVIGNTIIDDEVVDEFAHVIVTQSESRHANEQPRPVDVAGAANHVGKRLVV